MTLWLKLAKNKKKLGGLQFPISGDCRWSKIS